MSQLPEADSSARIAELRRICQDPVREKNDLAGALYGWRLSIYISSFFLRLGLSANAASWMMLLSGLSGSLLLLAPGWGRVAGAALVTLAFILDCVDGEMARYYGIDSYRWAAFDYIHHMTVKGLGFFCCGLGLYLEYGNPWAVAAGGAGSIFWLVLMAIRDLGTSLFAKKIVLDPKREQNPAYQRLRRNLETKAPAAASRVAAPDVWGADFRFGPWMIRAFLVSFDVAALLLLVAALLDPLVGPFRLFGGVQSPATLLLYLYAGALPLHAVDLLHQGMRRGGLRDDLYDLARRVERYRDEP